MSIIDYLQQGGKASAKDIITGLANILGIQLEEMAQLWEAGVQKYGSEEALSDALDTAVEGIEDPQSPEFKDAVASVFTEETQLYKQGGKLDQLVSRFAKGGNIDCGCGGKKLKCGGKPKKKEEGGIVKAQEGVALTRRQARDLAKLNRGFNNQQFGVGYANAKAMLRNNTDLKGKELRNKARLIVSGVKETPAPVIVETPKAIETPALTTPKEIVIKSLVKPQKSDEQLAMEVLRGLHGNGAARRASLGDRADAVQAIVNRTIASQRPLTSYGGEIAPSIVVAERTTRGPRLKWKDSEGYHVVNSTPKIVETGRDEEGRWYTVSNGRHGYDENGNYYVAEDLPGRMSRDEAMERASNLYAVPLYDKCGGKVEKAQNGKWISADKTIIIKNPNTAQADTTGTYSYANRNGEFHFAPNGERTLTEWFDGDMIGERYANAEWFKNHPYKNTFERIVGLGRKLLTPELEENARQRVANRTKVQENGGVVKGQSGINSENIDSAPEQVMRIPKYGTIRLLKSKNFAGSEQPDSTFTFAPISKSAYYIPAGTYSRFTNLDGNVETRGYDVDSPNNFTYGETAHRQFNGIRSLWEANKDKRKIVIPKNTGMY